jgi:bifunctional DNase/RNase
VKTHIRVGLFFVPLSLVTAMLGMLLFLPALVSGRALGSPVPSVEPCSDPSMKAQPCIDLVEMEVRDVIPIQEAHTNALVLVAKDGTVLPVFVDQPAAVAIAFRLAHRAPPHALSQDLLDNMVGQLGGKVTEVRINDTHDDSTKSRIFITQGQKKIGVDSRASDAVAMALTGGAHIYVSKQLLAKDGITKKEIDDMRKQMGMGVGGSGESGTSAPPPSHESPAKQPTEIKM